MSWHGLLHELGFLLTFAAAIGACIVLARGYAAQRRRGWMVAALLTPAAALLVVGRPDVNTLSVRLVITTAILFGFLTAVFAEVLKQDRIDEGFGEDDHRLSWDQRPARH